MFSGTQGPIQDSGRRHVVREHLGQTLFQCGISAAEMLHMCSLTLTHVVSTWFNMVFYIFETSGFNMFELTEMMLCRTTGGQSSKNGSAIKDRRLLTRLTNREIVRWTKASKPAEMVVTDEGFVGFGPQKLLMKQQKCWFEHERNGLHHQKSE